MEIFFQRFKKEEGSTNHSYYAQSLSLTQYAEGLQQPPDHFLPPRTPLSFQLLLLQWSWPRLDQVRFGTCLRFLDCF